MFLETHKQFRDNVSTRAREQKPALGPGYAEIYAKWEEENKENLYKWSAEECTERYVQKVGEEVKKDLKKLIEKAPHPKEEKKALQQQAERGQLLLVSTDGGKNFNAFLTAQEFKAKKGEALPLLSPTLLSTSSQDAFAGQALLHVLDTVEENLETLNAQQQEHWSVVNVSMKKGVVYVDIAKNAFNGEEENGEQYRIAAQTEGEGQPFVYTFIGQGHKEQHVLESQLPEAFKNRPVLVQQELHLSRRQAQGEEKVRESAIFNATAATWASMEALHQLVGQNRMEGIQGMQGTQGQRVVNVMAAKQAVAARFARQEEELKKSQERELKRKKAVQATQAPGQQKPQPPQSGGFNAAQKKIMKGAGIGAAIGAGAASILGGTTFLVSHITLFT